MANLNKVIFIGRLTRDPEVRTFSNGGKVARFGLVVNDRRKNKTSGQWEDDPMFIDVEAYNRGEGRGVADTVGEYTHKGSQVAVEGKLQLDQWDDKTTGQKRSKHKVVAFAVQLLDKKGDGAGPGPGDVPAADEVPAGSDEIPF